MPPKSKCPEIEGFGNHVLTSIGVSGYSVTTWVQVTVVTGMGDCAWCV